MKNEYKHNDDGTTHIFVETKNKCFPGKHTIILDTEDWDKVKEHKWGIRGSKPLRYPYAVTNIPMPRHERRKTKIDMQHVIVGKPQKGMMVDHINHNGLDNRKENLREVTNAQNQHNRRSGRNTSSRYKGVNPIRRSTPGWLASLKHEGRSIHIGHFDSEHEAALAYNKKALELWGEHAYLNEVPESYKTN